MFDSEEIVGKEIKRFHNKEQEYWGPIDHHFSDAFLSMTYDMLCSYFSGEEKRLSKAVFSTVTELVQNIADYNAKTFVEKDIPASLYSLVLTEHSAIVKCCNQILSKDARRINRRMKFLKELSKDQLETEFKSALLNGKSLGLIMLHRFQDVKFEWEIQKSKNGLEWLNIHVTLNYASFRN